MHIEQLIKENRTGTGGTCIKINKAHKGMQRVCPNIIVMTDSIDTLYFFHLALNIDQN